MDIIEAWIMRYLVPVLINAVDLTVSIICMGIFAYAVHLAN